MPTVLRVPGWGLQTAPGEGASPPLQLPDELIEPTIRGVRAIARAYPNAIYVRPPHGSTVKQHSGCFYMGGKLMDGDIHVVPEYGCVVGVALQRAGVTSNELACSGRTANDLFSQATPVAQRRWLYYCQVAQDGQKPLHACIFAADKDTLRESPDSHLWLLDDA